jgi:RNA polymerase sigma factor (sigma-70 family)
MIEPTEHRRLVELLRQARRQGETATPEAMEENLRWLVHLAMPEMMASPTLRWRVRAQAMGHRSWLGAIRARFATGPRPWESQPYREELPLWEELRGELTLLEWELLQLLLAADVRRLPKNSLLQQEAIQVIRRLLANLPEPQREALLLQLVQNLSVPEIAEVMGQSEADAQSLLEQAWAMVFQDGQRLFGRDGLA